MITAYVGLLGSGKSLSMCRDAYRIFRARLPQIYTDMRSARFPEMVYISAERPEMLSMVNNGLILLDEAQIIADARYWQKVPAVVLSALAQMRKNSLDLLYTTQIFENVDSRLRGLTNEVIYCKRIGPFILQQWRYPGSKETFKKRITRLDQSLFWLYDTTEILGKRVGVGLSSSAALREARERRSGVRREPPDSGARFKADIWRVSKSALVLTQEAADVYDWLVTNGHMRQDCREWAGVVRTEIARRRWLAAFGLGWDDACIIPTTTTYETPFMIGYSPADLDRELAAEQAIDSIEEFERFQKRKLRKERILS